MGSLSSEKNVCSPEENLIYITCSTLERNKNITLLFSYVLLFILFIFLKGNICIYHTVEKNNVVQALISILAQHTHTSKQGKGWRYESMWASKLKQSKIFSCRYSIHVIWHSTSTSTVQWQCTEYKTEGKKNSVRLIKISFFGVVS